MKNRALAQEWIKRGRSSLEIAALGKALPNVFYEDLCFHCQQSVEKALKGLLILLDSPFPKTHSIANLLEIIEAKGIPLPEEIKESIILTDYAVSTRYPGDYEPVDEEEYINALKIAGDVIGWVENLFKMTDG